MIITKNRFREIIHKIKLKIKKSPYPFILLTLGLFISFLNWSPGTWQTGWDTLHPEFNWKINIPRHLFGMWQENQGMGNVGGHSHAADMPRILTLFIADLFLPKMFLRYFWMFLTLIAGPLGVYFFVRDIIFRGTKNIKKSEIISFCSGLYYLFNLGTVQQYIVPLEMYTSLYGFLPWVFLYTSKVILDGKRHLLKLFLSVFFATPMAYAVTVFFGFYLTLLVYQGVLLISNKFWLNKKLIVNTIIANILIIGMSSYWLFPSLYFSVKHGDFVSESHINSIFSTDIFNHNVAHGNLWDLFLLKGFLVNWRNFDYASQDFYYLMESWTRYHTLTPLYFIQILLIIFLVCGLVYSLFKKNKYGYGIIGVFAVSAFMIMTTNPPLGFIFEFLRKNVGLFEEALRNPYTKFSVELMFAFSIFISFFALLIYDITEKFRIGRIKDKLIPIIFTLFFVIYMFPAFTGNLVSKDVRLKIPQEYFEMFEWFNDQEDSRRIAPLPVNTFWGWQYFDWGYQGAGFLWFGTKQPLLERDFDRWNPYNEQYYNEITEAIYSQDLYKLEHVVDKYGIGYLLLSKNTIAPGYGDRGLAINDTEDLLAKSNKLKKVKEFGDLVIYQNMDGLKNDFYRVEENAETVIEYPFQGVVRTKPSAGINIYKNDDKFYIEKEVNNIPYDNLQLGYRNLESIKGLIPFKLEAQRQNEELMIHFNLLLPSVYIDDQLVTPGNIVSKETIILNEADTKVSYVSLNDVQIYNLSDVGNDISYIGNGYINLNKINEIAAFGGVSNTINFSDDNGKISTCSDGLDFTAQHSFNNVSLWSYENIACIQKVFSFVKGDYLLITNYQYRSQFGDFPEYCILSNGMCQSNTSYKAVSLPDTVSSNQDAVYISDSELVGIRLWATKTKNELSNIEYYQVNTKVIPLFRKIQLNNSNFNKLITSYYKPYTITAKNKSLTIKVEIPNDFSHKLDEKNIFDMSSFDNFNEKNVLKRYDNGLNLTVKGRSGNIYDSLNLKGITVNTDYLLNVNLAKTEGIPLTVGIKDKYFEHYNLYERMNGLEDTFLVKRSYNPNSNEGYHLIFINENIGFSNTENNIREAELVPVWGELIESVLISNDYDKLVKKNKSSVNVFKITPFLYYIPSKIDSNENIVMDQSYESGWLCTGNSRSDGIVKGTTNMFKCQGGLIIFIPAIAQLAGYLVAMLLLFYSYLSFIHRN
jgi:hypothetical protein